MSNAHNMKTHLSLIYYEKIFVKHYSLVILHLIMFVVGVKGHKPIVDYYLKLDCVGLA